MKLKRPRTEERLNAEIREWTGRIQKLRDEMRASLNKPKPYTSTADELPPPRRGSKKR